MQTGTEPISVEQVRDQLPFALQTILEGAGKTAKQVARHVATYTKRSGKDFTQTAHRWLWAEELSVGIASGKFTSEAGDQKVNLVVLEEYVPRFKGARGTRKHVRTNIWAYEKSVTRFVVLVMTGATGGRNGGANHYQIVVKRAPAGCVGVFDTSVEFDGHFVSSLFELMDSQDILETEVPALPQKNMDTLFRQWFQKPNEDGMCL
ncbi:hypothetical protein JKP88DRAFT_214897, partial [Tribonema minus]